MQPDLSGFLMRSPCPDCGHLYGRVEDRNGQDTVRCGQCNRHCYNAPRTETGRKRRSVITVHEALNASTRARMIERATARCELCGAAGNLHVSHLLSVKDGMSLFTLYGIPLTEHDLNSDDNLACLCDACNLGWGALSVSPRLYVALLWRRSHGPQP